MSAATDDVAKTRLGVAGWPVAHSRSPVMQNVALALVGLGNEWHYQHLPLTPDLFPETVRALPASGFRGVNVTIPHKAAALAVATSASARARQIGAANTLVFAEDGSISADNTDAVALADALRGVLVGGVGGRSTLVLGAGGSARAAVWALVQGGAAEVRVWNRSPERGRALCAELGATAVETVRPADVIVNCTSVGLDPADRLTSLPLTDAVLKRAEVVVDFVYNAAGTPLADACASYGVPLIDGLELLVLQGAASFTLFTGLHAPVAAMRAAARGAR